MAEEKKDIFLKKTVVKNKTKTCSRFKMSDILVKQNKTQHVIFTGFRGSDKGWVRVSAIEEHQASSSETSDTVAP